MGSTPSFQSSGRLRKSRPGEYGKIVTIFTLSSQKQGPAIHIDLSTVRPHCSGSTKVRQSSSLLSSSLRERVDEENFICRYLSFQPRCPTLVLVRCGQPGPRGRLITRSRQVWTSRPSLRILGHRLRRHFRGDPAPLFAARLLSAHSHSWLTARSRPASPALGARWHVVDRHWSSPRYSCPRGSV